jgi:hypothetical protein
MKLDLWSMECCSGMCSFTDEGIEGVTAAPRPGARVPCLDQKVDVSQFCDRVLVSKANRLHQQRVA